MTLNELSTALTGAIDIGRIRRRAEALTANGVNYGDAAFARNAAICADCTIRPRHILETMK